MMRSTAGRRLAVRAAGCAGTLFVIVSGSFFLIRIAPGGPFDTGRRLDPEILAGLRRHYGLDQSLPQQYLHYLSNLAHGDLGSSYSYRDVPVVSILADSIPVSFSLVALALGLALAVGISAGIAAAFWKGRAVDRAVGGLSTVALAIPSVMLGPLLILLFAVYLGWLPPSGWDEGAQHWVLPTVTLAVPYMAVFARITRGSLADVLAAAHIRTAHAFGLPLRVLIRRALRNALIPIISLGGPTTVAMITGTAVVETIFGIPGIGQHFVQAALQRDYALAMGTILLLAVLIVGINALVDLAYGIIDPRIRLDKR